MYKLKLYENEAGFYIDYIFTDKSIKKCLRISSDNDYFSFSVFSPYSQMVNEQIITIGRVIPIFLPIKKLLANQPYVEVLEEGSSEGKSIVLKNNENSVDIILNLTDIPTNVATISLTNIRLASPNVLFGKESPHLSDFKNKLNSALLEMKELLKESTM